ncbi:MAG: hypothetical protein RL662_1283 [Bacteroidota bacterium]|jgi:hypothetical protein
MKRNRIRNTIIAGILALVCAFNFTACEDVNDWGTDQSTNRIFSPVIFEPRTVTSTYAEFSFSSVPHAQTYVVELSKDSLAFGTIMWRGTIDVEQLVPDSTSTSKLYIFATTKELIPGTRYSARMKVTSNNNLPESLWSNYTFVTTTK